MAKTTKKEYTVETSPFYDKSHKLRANLTELKASDGEEIVLARKRYFKKDEYVKFIINNEFDLKQFHSMPKIANTILQYILYHCLEYNTPTFRFKVTAFCNILEVNPSLVFNGLKILTDYKYIAKTESKEVYWINHNFFYKGNFMTDKYLVTKKH
jgi:hypothetical protein